MKLKKRRERRREVDEVEGWQDGRMAEWHGTGTCSRRIQTLLSSCFYCRQRLEFFHSKVYDTMMSRSRLATAPLRDSVQSFPFLFS